MSLPCPIHLDISCNRNDGVLLGVFSFARLYCTRRTVHLLAPMDTRKLRNPFISTPVVSNTSAFPTTHPSCEVQSLYLDSIYQISRSLDLSPQWALFNDQSTDETARKYGSRHQDGKITIHRMMFSLRLYCFLSRFSLLISSCMV